MGGLHAIHSPGSLLPHASTHGFEHSALSLNDNHNVLNDPKISRLTRPPCAELCQSKHAAEIWEQRPCNGFQLEDLNILPKKLGIKV